MLSLPIAPTVIDLPFALNPVFEIVSLSVLVAILAFDLILAFKRPHVPSTKESAIWHATCAHGCRGTRFRSPAAIGCIGSRSSCAAIVPGSYWLRLPQPAC